MPKAKTAERFDLAAIQTAIVDDDASGALAAALVAWRHTRAPVLADLIDVVSPAAADPIHALLAKFGTVPASELPVMASELAGVDDPRVAKAVATWTLDPPTTSSSTYPFWTRSLDAMTRARDVRVVPLLKKRLKSKPGGSQFWPKFYKALHKAVATIEATHVAAVDDKLVKRLAKAADKLSASATPAAAAKKPGGDPLVHLQAGRVQDAIDALLERWRMFRAPPIADLIDRATRLLPSWDRPLGLDDKSVQAAWEAAYATDPHATLPQLLDNLIVGGPAAGEKHLVALAKLPDDPRIAWRLATQCASHSPSPERTQFWKSLLELVARIADPRVAPALVATFDNFTGDYYNHHRQARRIIGPWAQNPPLAGLSGDQGKLDAALAKLEAKRDTTERDLVFAICDAWDDNGPRLVYADWLAERQSPRGEMIVLSCKKVRTEAEEKRLAAMRKITNIYGVLEHFAAAWQGDRGLALERGMPTKLTVGASTSPLIWRQLAGYPLLAAVASIEFGMAPLLPAADDFARVLTDPMARRLARVTSVPKTFQVSARGWTRRGDTLVRS